MAYGQSKPACRRLVPLLIFLASLASAPAARAAAQNTTEGTLEFFGAGKVEKSSGVWIDGQYAGYLGELKGKRTVSVSPGKHRIKVELPGDQTFETEVNLAEGQKSVVKTELVKGTTGQANPQTDQPSDSGHTK